MRKVKSVLRGFCSDYNHFDLDINSFRYMIVFHHTEPVITHPATGRVIF